ncbi:hypothetical protein [Cognatishimia sp. MH4019]|uniref:hypothetical protein n=1 Tax=Cognatishimia sp. MH4019 TaxID=2854030 RepID=UPI001CD6E82C|nr:hypothetical protein [Cognatishimia sp. MH4019]
MPARLQRIFSDASDQVPMVREQRQVVSDHPFTQLIAGPVLALCKAERRFAPVKVARMRIAAAVFASVVLVGCDTGIGDSVARETARSVVKPIVAQYLPGPGGEAITDCVIDNASGAEILQLARAAATGPDDSTVQVVLDISRRPDTINCISRDGLSAVLGQFG